MSLLVQPRFARSSCSQVRHVLGLGLLACGLTALLLTSLSSSAFGAPKTTAKNDSLSKAKAAVAQAKKDADAAAARYSEAYGALNKLNDRLSEVQSQLETTETSMANLQVKASNQAKDAYIRSSNDDYVQIENVADEKRRSQFLATVSEFDDTQLTQLVGMKEDLQISQDELSALQKDRRKSLDEIAEQKKTLYAKLNTAAQAQKTLETKLAKQAKAKRVSATSNGKAGQIINPGNGPMACPVQGSTAFTNDWGRPRSGGRRHKGTDIFAPRGTPNVAVVDGRVMFRNEGTGGKSAYVTGNNGVTYYYTHLNGYAGGARSVKRGEVIGYTGNTGNAAGGSTHTHFEIRPGGSSAVNPYPTLRSIC